MQRNQRSNCQHSLNHRKREFKKNICFIDYAKACDCVDHNALWKILKEMGIPDHLSPEKPFARQEVTEPDMKLVQNQERNTSRLYIVTPAYLTYMQSTSCKMPG